jgi:iron complex outermembrane receptor protein
VADFSAFVPKNCNWGVSLNRPRYSLMLKWNYRADQRLALRTGTGIPAGDYQWLEGAVKLDVNAEYRLSKRIALFVNARNVTNEPYVLRYGAPSTPAYAQQFNTQDFGVQYAIGVKGSF